MTTDDRRSSLTISPSPAAGRVFVAEDSPTNKLIAVSILSRAGFEVGAFENGRLLFEAMRHQPSQIVLMDIHMPEMDGLQATAAIRALPGPAAAVPVIAMTAYAAENDRESCLAAGMNDYVSKPIDGQELLGAVGRWLGQEKATVADEQPNRRPVDESLSLGTLERLEAEHGIDAVREMARAFVTETALRIECIARALRAADMAALGREAQTLKASSGSFGAAHLHGHAEAIVLAAVAGDHRDAAKTVRFLPRAAYTACRALASRYVQPA